MNTNHVLLVEPMMSLAALVIVSLSSLPNCTHPPPYTYRIKKPEPIILQIPAPNLQAN